MHSLSPGKRVDRVSDAALAAVEVRAFPARALVVDAKFEFPLRFRSASTISLRPVAFSPKTSSNTWINRSLLTVTYLVQGTSRGNVPSCLLLGVPGLDSGQNTTLV